MIVVQQGRGKTGTAPGTTTLVLGPGGKPGLAGVSLGVSVPTDFDRARMMNYLPVTKGWIVGTLGAEGQASTQLTPEETAALKAHYEMRTARAEALTAEKNLDVHADVKTASLKSQRSERIWTAVTALVGVGSLVIAALALRQ